MSQFVNEIRQMIVPGRNTRHGPLPPLLVSMTVVTGLVDAFSYLVLGHVFVANMTGNVVLLGFALAGAPGFSIAASVAALGAFGVGAFVGGNIGTRLARNRGELFSIATSIQAAFLVAGVILAVLAGSPVPDGYRYFVIVVLAIAMGIQNASARKLAVADLTTTVLTMTITGIAADGRAAGGRASHAGRRLTAVGAMLLGAVVGATLVLHAPIAYPLAIALVVTAIAAATSWMLATSGADWVREAQP